MSIFKLNLSVTLNFKRTQFEFSCSHKISFNRSKPEIVMLAKLHLFVCQSVQVYQFAWKVFSVLESTRVEHDFDNWSQIWDNHRDCPEQTFQRIRQRSSTLIIRIESYKARTGLFEGQKGRIKFYKLKLLSLCDLYLDNYLRNYGQNSDLKPIKLVKWDPRAVWSQSFEKLGNHIHLYAALTVEHKAKTCHNFSQFLHCFCLSSPYGPRRSPTISIVHGKV